MRLFQQCWCFQLLALPLHEPDGGEAAMAKLVHDGVGDGAVVHDVTDVNWMIAAGHILPDIFDMFHAKSGAGFAWVKWPRRLRRRCCHCVVFTARVE